MENLKLALERRLSGDVLAIIQRVATLASDKDICLYLVGGAVRDVLLDREVFDIDLVAEGDAPLLARELAHAVRGSIKVHDRFGTVTYSTDGISIDLVTARSETYPEPGALPIVRPGSIADDLYRRDFTINALAVHLSPPHYGELIDPYHGQEDMQQHLIRIIHPRSFIDDATRILRALRYAQRLGFQLEQETAVLLQRDRSFLGTISGDRIRGELELIMQEKMPEKVLQRAANLGILTCIHSSLPWNDSMPARFSHARIYPGVQAGAALYFALLAYDMSEKNCEEIISFLKLPHAVARVMRDTIMLKSHLSPLEENHLSRSKIYNLLYSYAPEAVVALDIATDIPVVHQYVNLFLTELRYITSAINGKDLARLGIKPGPRMGGILRIVKEARLDGKVSTKEEEIELVKRLLKI